MIGIQYKASFKSKSGPWAGVQSSPFQDGPQHPWYADSCSSVLGKCSGEADVWHLRCSKYSTCSVLVEQNPLSTMGQLEFTSWLLEFPPHIGSYSIRPFLFENDLFLFFSCCMGRYASACTVAYGAGDSIFFYLFWDSLTIWPRLAWNSLSRPNS